MSSHSSNSKKVKGGTSISLPAVCESSVTDADSISGTSNSLDIGVLEFQISPRILQNPNLKRNASALNRDISEEEVEILEGEKSSPVRKVSRLEAMQLEKKQRMALQNSPLMSSPAGKSSLSNSPKKYIVVNVISVLDNTKCHVCLVIGDGWKATNSIYKDSSLPVVGK